MKNRSQQRVFISSLGLFTVLALSGFSSVKLSDIETAVIKKDFVLAEQLSGQFLSGEAPENQVNEALYYQGLSQLYLGKYEESRTTFRQIIDNHPESSAYDRAYLGTVDSYYMAGDYEEALHWANKWLTLRPRSEFLSLAYLKIGRANLRLARWPDARKYLKKVTKEFPGTFEAHIAGQLLAEKQYFAVQVGAFLERSRSENLARELKNRGEYAYIIETVDADDRTFYRVRIGRFSRLDRAQELQQKLSRLGYPTRIYP